MSPSYLRERVFHQVFFASICFNILINFDADHILLSVSCFIAT